MVSVLPYNSLVNVTHTYNIRLQATYFKLYQIGAVTSRDLNDCERRWILSVDLNSSLMSYVLERPKRHADAKKQYKTLISTSHSSLRTALSGLWNWRM